MSSTLEHGAIFAGRYRVLRRIATGGMGVIYEVLHLETERRRALKVMLPGVLGNDELRQRFVREAKVVSHVESDFIVDVVDAGIDAATETPFLVMELLRGEDLGKRLKRLGRLDPGDVVTYLYHAALALDLMHRASVVHRDVKPENLFLMEREDGPPRIKVLDFGVAKVVAESGIADATQGLGTPLYMAPEQYDPRARITGAADLYALGMVAYALLVGSAYWAEEASSGRLFALAVVTMRGPRELASERAAARGVGLPPAFDAWFAQMTAVDPAGRFASASEAVRALADVFCFAPPSRPIPSSPFGWSATAHDARDAVRSLASELPAPPPAPSSALAPARATTAKTARSPAARWLLAGTIFVLSVGAATLAGIAFSIRLGDTLGTLSPADEPGALPAPPPVVAAAASVGSAGAAPSTSSRRARPSDSAVVAPARSGRAPPGSPLRSRD